MRCYTAKLELPAERIQLGDRLLPGLHEVVEAKELFRNLVPEVTILLEDGTRMYFDAGRAVQVQRVLRCLEEPKLFAVIG